MFGKTMTESQENYFHQREKEGGDVNESVVHKQLWKTQLHYNYKIRLHRYFEKLTCTVSCSFSYSFTTGAV